MLRDSIREYSECTLCVNSLSKIINHCGWSKYYIFCKNVSRHSSWWHMDFLMLARHAYYYIYTRTLRLSKANMPYISLYTYKNIIIWYTACQNQLSSRFAIVVALQKSLPLLTTMNKARNQFLASVRQRTVSNHCL